jgi:hypothetical protein
VRLWASLTTPTSRWAKTVVQLSNEA